METTEQFQHEVTINGVVITSVEFSMAGVAFARSAEDWRKLADMLAKDKDPGIRARADVPRKNALFMHEMAERFKQAGDIVGFYDRRDDVARDRDESESCERLTPGCSVRHGSEDSECATW